MHFAGLRELPRATLYFFGNEAAQKTGAIGVGRSLEATSSSRSSECAS